MSDTGIQWTTKVWNPVAGCTKVSEGCRNCYAMRDARRQAGIADAAAVKHAAGVGRAVNPTAQAYREVVKRDPEGRALPQWNNAVRCLDHKLAEPMKWGAPQMVFVNSMSDLFHDSVPFAFIDKVFAAMALCPQHTFQVLTKRPERMLEYLESPHRRNIPVYDAATSMIEGDWDRMPGRMQHERSSGDSWWPLPNVWLGTSAENQETLEARVPFLLRCPAAVRFLSCEPLLGGLDLHKWMPGDVPASFSAQDGWVIGYRHINELETTIWREHLDWVIVGGESGPGARPCDIAWIRGVVEQCQTAGVPVFVKQLGKLPRIPSDREGEPTGLPCSQGEDGHWYATLGDKKGGDMDEWPADLRVREFPEVGA